MHNRSDQLELLAIIEDELDVAAAAQLRKRLASEPRVMEAIERMRHDRIALRALGDVQVPTDVLDQLEPLLARPMLAEPLEPLNGTVAGNGAVYAAPGQFRKQYRRQALRIRWRRIAVAAIMFMALIAGVWAAMNGLIRTPNTPDDRMMAASGSGDSDGEVIASTELSGAVHHGLPPLEVSRPMLASYPAAHASARSNQAKVVVAEFAIVVNSQANDEAEAAFASVAGMMERTVSLVRNFSYAEATRIAEELRVAGGAQRVPRNTPMTASTAGAPVTSQDQLLKSLADSVRHRIKISAAPSPAAEVSGTISGPSQLAPSLEQQLEFSSRGATHSVAVPVTHLKSFLEQAAIATGQATSLRMVSSEVDGATDDALSAWVAERARLQQAFDRLQNAPPDAIVLIPVVIREN